VLCKAGQEAKFIYLVKEGRCSILAKNQAMIKDKLTPLFCKVLDVADKEWIGEEFLLDRQVRFGREIDEESIDLYKYQVVAQSPMKVLKLSV